jgi:hypothetical protein
MYVR